MNFQTTDAILSNANETIPLIENEMIEFDEFTECEKDMDYAKQSNTNLDESILKNQTIPTAIVKPKYQKSSFDERQLPAIAYADRDKPWYDKLNVHSNDVTNRCPTTTTLGNTKKIHLPEFDRKAKKHMKQNSSNHTKSAHPTSEIEDNSKCSSKQNIANEETTHAKCETVNGKDVVYSAMPSRSSAQKIKSNGASVAIVQPRKKDKMDERKLMETIVQMQVKKNSMDYGNRNNKNNNINNNINNNNNNQGKVAVKTSSIQTKDDSSNGKYHSTNNNNERNTTTTTTSMPIQTKKDQKDNSGKIDLFVVLYCTL